MIEIFDSSAMIALLRAEEGGSLVAALIADEDAVCHAHVFNLTEVFYDFHRNDGEEKAQLALDFLRAGIHFYTASPAALWQDAGRLKSAYKSVSLADCYCLALARYLSGEVVTADHHEFDSLASLELRPIRFIR